MIIPKQYKDMDLAHWYLAGWQDAIDGINWSPSAGVLLAALVEQADLAISAYDRAQQDYRNVTA